MAGGVGWFEDANQNLGFFVVVREVVEVDRSLPEVGIMLG